MYPHHEEKIRWDDYGEIIKPEDWIDSRYGNTGCGIFIGGKKLKRFLDEHQLQLMKLPNFDNWGNGNWQAVKRAKI